PKHPRGKPQRRDLRRNAVDHRLLKVRKVRMANNIERLNYYEREYLRSFDFIAEQNYHMEMRRRLNLALHLWGIVEGLDVKLGEVVAGAPAQYYISPGMAIDAYGREIFLFA